MPDIVASAVAPRHRLLTDEVESRTSGNRTRVAKAGLAAERASDWRVAVGRAIERTRHLCGLSLKEFADKLGRDERQVARWEKGEERPHFDAILAVDALKTALVIAVAELANGVEIETVVTIKRRA